MAVMVPVLLCAYLAWVFDLHFISHFPTGAISVNEFSVRLHEVVVRLAVINLATALVPSLGVLAAGGRLTELLHLVRRAYFCAFFMLIPLSIAILCFAPWALAGIFERGKFTSVDTSLVSLYWGLYSLSLAPMALVHVTSRALQAKQRYGQLLLSGAVLLSVHVASLVCLIPALGIAALPMAHLLSNAASGAFSFQMLRQGAAGWGGNVAPSWRHAAGLGAVTIFSGASYLVATMLSHSEFAWSHLAQQSVTARMAALASAAGSAVLLLGTYVAAVHRLRIPELDAVFGKFTGRHGN
jgi:putative peptidoglycan lipid II flippase